MKRIVHRVLSDLFRTIEEFDIQPDEFWSAMAYLTTLGKANEVGWVGCMSTTDTWNGNVSR